MTLWERYLVPENVCKSRVAILALERRGSVQHFVDQDSKGPPIDCTCVSTALDNLWRNVLFGTNERIGSEIVDTGFGVNGW